MADRVSVRAAEITFASYRLATQYAGHAQTADEDTMQTFIDRHIEPSRLEGIAEDAPA